jgi:GTP-binding nuclear protein Ran
MNANIPTYKVVFLGDGGVGKTTLLKRYIQEEFEKIYRPTLGAEVHPILFNTNHGAITLNIWDTPGQGRYSGLYEGYVLGAHAAVIFYSVDSRTTARNIAHWQSKVPNVPNTLIVGTKGDYADKLGLDTLKVSAKTGEGINEMFMNILRTVSGKADLVIV